MKRIVICADGTGNTTIKGRGTNVFKLYEAVDQASHRWKPSLEPQVALYHDGVGTESVKWLRMLTGATGWGLSRHVKQLYGELARVYAPGDKLFLFGFSRGAFTVRTLAGLINACGVLDLAKYPTNAAFERGVSEAYGAYRESYNSWLTRLFHSTKPLNAARVADLRKRFSVAVPEFEDEPTYGNLIEFVGVWDTVDAVGLPILAADIVNTVIYAFKFSDRSLSQSVAHACHALAVDEERQSFQPVLWDEAATVAPGRIEQVWFAGVHSNVGGGYPRQGMSLVALDWIMARAEGHGLRFVPAERDQYRYHADVDDKMYDSRRGLGIFYRWRPRNIGALCAANGVTPQVHRSVFERIARNTEGYAPGSLPANPHVVSQSQPAVARTIANLVQAHHKNGPPLMERAHKLQTVGRWSYWLFVWAVIVTGGLFVWDYTAALSHTTSWSGTVAALATTIIKGEFVGTIAGVLWHHPLLVTWLAVSLALGMWVDARLDRRYSSFWHENHMRLMLRKALGLG